jgi:Protein of unknown function (DUF3072)
MTDAQASYLQTLSEQAQQPLTLRKDLTKAEASKLIDEMRKRLVSNRSCRSKSHGRPLNVERRTRKRRAA